MLSRKKPRRNVFSLTIVHFFQDFLKILKHRLSSEFLENLEEMFFFTDSSNYPFYKGLTLWMRGIIATICIQLFVNDSLPTTINEETFLQDFQKILKPSASESFENLEEIMYYLHIIYNS